VCRQALSVTGTNRPIRAAVFWPVLALVPNYSGSTHIGRPERNRTFLHKATQSGRSYTNRIQTHKVLSHGQIGRRVRTWPFTTLYHDKSDTATKRPSGSQMCVWIPNVRCVRFLRERIGDIGHESILRRQGASGSIRALALDLYRGSGGGRRRTRLTPPHANGRYADALEGPGGMGSPHTKRAYAANRT
jgi:hypothetical protein